MLGRRVMLNVVFFALTFVVMMGWALRNVVSIDAIDRPYPLSAEFSNAFGVLDNAEVTYRGVAYGRVKGVTRTDTGVRVAMEIDRGRHVPEGAGALISRKSAIGEPYVDLLPPEGYSGGGPYLRRGAAIPLSRTQVPLEFSELLRSAGTLIASIPPDALGTVVRELALGLDGRSQSLRDLATSSDQLASTFAARTAALDRLLTNNTRLTATLTAERGSLGRSLTDLSTLAAALRSSSGSTTLLLDRGSQLLDHASALVAANKANLDCDLKVLERLIDLSSTDRRLAGLAATLDLGPRAFSSPWDTRDVEADGVWVRVGTVNNSTNPPQQFVPPKTLPAVRAVPTCRSSLPASGGDYRPSSAAGHPERRPPTPVPAVALVLATVAAAVAIARSRRAQPAR